MTHVSPIAGPVVLGEHAPSQIGRRSRRLREQLDKRGDGRIIARSTPTARAAAWRRSALLSADRAHRERSGLS
jgi:hypothetical protein